MGIASGSVVAVTYRGKVFGQDINFCRHVVVAGSPSGTILTNLQQIAAAYDVGGASGAMEAYLACLGADYQLASVRTQQILPFRTAAYDRIVGTPNGTHAGVTTKPNDSCAVTFKGLIGDRSNVSTVKIGPTPDSAAAAGLITAPYTLLAADVGDKWSLEVVPAPWAPGQAVFPVIFKRSNGDVRPIADYAVGITSRVMRRRTVGVGS